MPTIRSVFAVETIYVEGAEAKRAPFRAEHLDRLEKLYLEGALAAAGVYDDLKSGLLLVQVQTEEAAAAVIEADVYFRNGIWTGYRIRPFNLVVADE